MSPVTTGVGCNRYSADWWKLSTTGFVNVTAAPTVTGFSFDRYGTDDDWLG